MNVFFTQDLPARDRKLLCSSTQPRCFLLFLFKFDHTTFKRNQSHLFHDNFRSFFTSIYIAYTELHFHWNTEHISYSNNRDVMSLQCIVVVNHHTLVLSQGMTCWVYVGSVSYTHLVPIPFIRLRWNFGELLCARPRRFMNFFQWGPLGGSWGLPHLLLNHWTDFNQTWHKYFTRRKNQHRICVFRYDPSGVLLGSFGVFHICLLYTSRCV